MKFFNYYHYLIGTVALVLSTSLLATKPISIGANAAPLRLTLQDKTIATVSIQNNKIIAKLQNGKLLTLVNNVNNIPEYARDIWIQDFNFDGFQDIAVTTRVNPVSNDQNYTIFTWENRLKHFIPLHFANGLSNLEIAPHKKQVTSSYQSNDFWTEDTYRYSNKQPYLYSKSILVASDIWHTTVYSPDHRIIRSLVSNDGEVTRPPHPVLIKVRNTVPLYQQPLPSTKLPLSLQQGNVVTIVDFKRGRGRFYWVSVRANINNAVLKGWTLLSNLVSG